MNALVDFTDIPLYGQYVDAVSSSVSKIRNKIKWLNTISAEVNREEIERLSKFDFVNKIELVERFRIAHDYSEYSSDGSPVFETQFPDGPLADTLSYGTGNAVTQITQIKVNLVHNQGIRGQGIMIASLDAGFSNLDP